jgi:hypothetical protein
MRSPTDAPTSLMASTSWDFTLPGLHDSRDAQESQALDRTVFTQAVAGPYNPNFMTTPCSMATREPL